MKSILQLTKNDLPQILNNFSLEKLFSLARLDLGLLAAKDHHTTTFIIINFLDESSEKKLYGVKFYGEEFFGEELFGEELSSGRIALGKNCRGRIVWRRIHREELITVYY
jgi:hypothetical protein